MGRMAVIKHQSKRGRPSVGERFAHTAYLRRTEADTVKEICALTGLSRTALLEQLISDGLGRIDLMELRDRHGHPLLFQRTG